MLDELVSNLSANSFQLSLPHCELRQCGTDSPRTYSGPGFVQQDVDGHLVLRMFATEKLDQRERLARFLPSGHTPGALIPESTFYDLTATDQRGCSWRAERQPVRLIFGVGNEIHSRLRRLERVEDLGKPGPSITQRWFIPSRIELPWHLRTSTGQSISVDRFEFEDEAFSWKVRKTEQGLDVQMTVKNRPLEPHGERFLYALGMLTGEILEPLVSFRFGDGRLVACIHPPPSDVPTKLSGPMDLRYDQVQDAHRFLACCLHRAEQAYPTPIDQLMIVYRFWHRIARAQSNDIENSSLVLSVAIEGVIKALFHSKHDADTEFAHHLESASQAVTALGVHERIRSLMHRCLENAAVAKPKDTMHRLKEQGVIADSHIKAWNELRHAGAHGALLEYDNVAFQEHLDRYFCCLDFFYRLAFVVVGYSGQCVGRSKPGWPRSTFPPNITPEKMPA